MNPHGSYIRLKQRQIFYHLLIGVSWPLELSAFFCWSLSQAIPHMVSVSWSVNDIEVCSSFFSLSFKILQVCPFLSFLLIFFFLGCLIWEGGGGLVRMEGERIFKQKIATLCLYLSYQSFSLWIKGYLC